MSANPETIKHWQPGLSVMNANKVLANTSADEILTRLQTETAIQIANSLGINRNALYAWLLRNCPEQWQALSTAVQLGKVTDYQDRLDTDDTLDGVGTSRIREAAKIAMWQLSKTSKMYADKQEINAGISITVNVNRDLADNSITIDQDPPVPLPGALSDGGGGK